MREAIADALKAATKEQDRLRMGTLRLVNAAIKDRDIANRSAGRGPASDDEIVQMLAKMIKQREESAKIYADNGRGELAAQEQGEIAVIREFMPRQMDDAAVEAAVRAAIAELGASGMKDMGRVMGALKERHAGAMDFGKANGVAKKLLQPV